MNTPESPLYYTVNELAERWRCSKDLVRDLIDRNELAAIRLGAAVRIKAASVEAIESGSQH